MSTEGSAQRIWNNARRAEGARSSRLITAWRGLAVPKTENLRFVASLKHKSGASYPAIIARVEERQRRHDRHPADLPCA